MILKHYFKLCYCSSQGSPDRTNRREKNLLKGIGPEVMEAVNLPSVSRRIKKANGIIHFESTGLRDKGYLCENPGAWHPSSRREEAHPSSFLACVGSPPHPAHGLDDAHLHWALVIVNFTYLVYWVKCLSPEALSQTHLKCFISYLSIP